MNSGRYTLDGGKLVITMNRANPKKIVTEAPKDGKVIISTVHYEKK
jgi:hypothetical protein